MKTTISISLDDRRDRDLLDWLAKQENKSAAVRQALRDHINHRSVSLNDLYQAIQDLRTAPAAHPAADSHKTVGASEPPDIAAAIDNLGL